ncbi:MAG: hypothetical protein NVSMB19_12530 [Vulcanimicrobiaceae bacterium]
MYGPRLTMCRDGGAVRWALDGQRAIVEPDGAGAVRATFVERATRDSVSPVALAALYRAERSYRLNEDDCSQLAADIAAFFSGKREPHFVFAGFRESGAVRS